jgi:hypothetical protein
MFDTLYKVSVQGERPVPRQAGLSLIESRQGTGRNIMICLFSRWFFTSFVAPRCGRPGEDATGASKILHAIKALRHNEL